jgi:hypothetical protein
MSSNGTSYRKVTRRSKKAVVNALFGPSCGLQPHARLSPIILDWDGLRLKCLTHAETLDRLACSCKVQGAVACITLAGTGRHEREA